METTPTTLLYDAAFERERQNRYPAVDAFEARMGAMVDRDALEAAARVLACPLKVHAPCWQHGRVIYAAARSALRDAIYAGKSAQPVNLVDVGTAKGFSALVLVWALRDAGIQGRVVSLDVIDPAARVRRNTVAEVGGHRTLPEILAPWREAETIEFVQSDAATWLMAHPMRVHLAVLDGKHTYQAVYAEQRLLARFQQPGDVIVYDDLQIPGVSEAIRALRGYAIERVAALPERVYAIARRL